MPFLKLRDTGTSCGIPFTPGQSVREILDATGTRVRSGCNGTGACGLCRIRVEAGEVHGPTTKEEYLVEEGRRARGVRLACQVIPEGDLEIEILSPAGSLHGGVSPRIRSFAAGKRTGCQGTMRNAGAGMSTELL